MNLNVDYDRLVGDVLGDSVRVASNAFNILALGREYADVRSVLHKHARRYMEVKNQHELYAAFRDFADELFRFAKLPYQIIDPHGRPLQNDYPYNDHPQRRSVILCPSRKFY